MTKPRSLTTLAIPLLLAALIGVAWALRTWWAFPHDAPHETRAEAPHETLDGTPVPEKEPVYFELRSRCNPAGLSAHPAYKRIRLGMTLDQVKTVIGVPPGNYDPSPRRGGIMSGPFGAYAIKTGLPSEHLPDAMGRPAPGYPEKITLEIWIWEDSWIWVAFDKRGAAVGYYLLESLRDDDEHRR